MIHRIASLALALVAIASSAGAATLSVAPDKLVYNIGETVTLTVLGDDQDAFTYYIFGELKYSGALVDNGTRTQTPVGPGWVLDPLPASDDGVLGMSGAFAQFSLELPDSTAEFLPGAFSTVTLIARAAGVVDVAWATWSPSTPGDFLYFFDIPDAPGTSFTIVPEPGTAALLGLGLLAIAACRTTPKEDPNA